MTDSISGMSLVFPDIKLELLILMKQGEMSVLFHTATLIFGHYESYAGCPTHLLAIDVQQSVFVISCSK